MFLPNSKQLKKHYKKLQSNKYIAKFSKMVGAKNLWHFNEYSASMGLAVGIACAWIPLPFHTILAIIIAIILDCNIPLVAASIWVANPLTMPIMYYYAYRLGEVLLGISPTRDIKFHLSINDMLYDLHEVWQPFLLGCLVLGLVSGLIAKVVMQLLWRHHPHVKKHLEKHNGKR